MPPSELFLERKEGDHGGDGKGHNGDGGIDQAGADLFCLRGHGQLHHKEVEQQIGCACKHGPEPRTLDEHGKELVVLVLNKEKERLTREEYGIGSGSAPRARVLDRPVIYSGRRDIPLYDLPVSAGPGEFLDGLEFETIHVPDGPVTRSASYALRISGNSMNPRYKDGDILMVEKCDRVELGELGIFVLDNASYFKKFGGDRLISLNPDYEDILLSRFASVNCCGRVLGKLKRK